MKEKSHSKQNHIIPDYSFVMASAYSELMTDEIPDRVRMLRFEALKSLQDRLAVYQRNGYMARLIHAIAEKRCRMIMEATTKAEMKKILELPSPHYDGSKFVPDKYHVPEEELICWSETSLRGHAGYKRYCEVFRELFPEQEEKIAAGICAANVPQEAA